VGNRYCVNDGCPQSHHTDADTTSLGLQSIDTLPTVSDSPPPTGHTVPIFQMDVFKPLKRLERLKMLDHFIMHPPPDHILSHNCFAVRATLSGVGTV
jgi:hypothetical protein